MLLMNIPPLLSTGSTTHSMSQGKGFPSQFSMSYIVIILPMENLPPINEMYASLREEQNFDVFRRYEDREKTWVKQSSTKKGSYLDDEIKVHCSPGPANQSNLQGNWAKAVIRTHKYADRKTYVDEIQAQAKKRSSPSPNSYKLTMPWPEKTKTAPNHSTKINFLDHSEFESTQTPGPGTYLVATQILKRGTENTHTENHARQPIVNLQADMNTYDPAPYGTFKKLERVLKAAKSTPGDGTKGTQEKRKENKSPGPGEYQMINHWKGKDRMPKGSLSYMSRISKGVAPTVYYH